MPDFNTSKYPISLHVFALAKKNSSPIFNVKEILLGFGLHCFGCPMSQMETIEEAASVHGVDVDLMIEKINEFLNK